MPSHKVLTIEPASSVTCGHQVPPSLLGIVQTTSNAKIRVYSGVVFCPVLLESSIHGKPIGDCGTIPSSGTSTSIKCTAVTTNPPPVPPATAITGGWASKLTVNGHPVILDTLKGMTNGTVANITPQALLKGTANHNKLTSA